jgi:methyltransferase family protein
MSGKSPLITILHLLGNLLPSDYLKTTCYLNLIARPRKGMRLALMNFYRMELVYDVLAEAKAAYKGNFSVLEFGTAEGYAFTKLLYATKYLSMDERVTVHAFDAFEGMPAPVDSKDLDLITNDSWVKGQYRGSYEALNDYCSRHYKNYQIHKGYFESTITDELLGVLRKNLPILVWIDCDYYSSTRTVFERLIPVLPNGCVIYFDDYELNFGSRFTGEARIVYEINHGMFGDGIELVLDSTLSLSSKSVYRFIRYESDIQYEPVVRKRMTGSIHPRSNGSPFP